MSAVIVQKYGGSVLRDDASPAFFKQLRMDVCALYLSEPAVWRRIGFPGPSTRSGGSASRTPTVSRAARN